jgi:hypothetical protein
LHSGGYPTTFPTRRLSSALAIRGAYAYDRNQAPSRRPEDEMRIRLDQRTCSEGSDGLRRRAEPGGRGSSLSYGVAGDGPHSSNSLNRRVFVSWTTSVPSGRVV